MKSVVECEKENESYPKLKSYGELVVLFVRPRSGFVVNSPNEYINKIGNYKYDWVEDCFTEFRGKVTLKN